jgi:hypothetical protein
MNAWMVLCAAKGLCETTWTPSARTSTSPSAMPAGSVHVILQAQRSAALTSSVASSMQPGARACRRSSAAEPCRTSMKPRCVLRRRSSAEMAPRYDGDGQGRMLPMT